MNLTECVSEVCSLSGLGVPGFEGFEIEILHGGNVLTEKYEFYGCSS